MTIEEPAPSEARPSRRGAHLNEHGEAMFEGRHSRRHAFMPIRRWHLLGHWHRIKASPRLRQTTTFVQFAGFPRSGHSLVGSLVDAHPQALISHELDAMGLFRKGLSPRQIDGLVVRNAQRFSDDGRWWNGHRYAVDGLDGTSRHLRVIGDKKGDWATRWCAEDPDLIERFAIASRRRTKWVLVTRHPLDNIATMSLRKGGSYDKLRIESSSIPFSERLKAAQERGEISVVVRDDMLLDYRALAAATEEMKRRVPSADWYELSHEDFVKDPRAELSALAQFLGLEADEVWLNGASALVHESTRKSRDLVAWTEDQKAAVAATIAARSFLEIYRDAR